MRFLIFLGLIVLTSSCYNFKPKVGAPWMQDLLRQGPKDAPILFQQGWIDGCETGISATSNALQRQFYTFTQNPELAQKDVYYTGWKTAYWYCSRYVMQYLRRQII